MVCYSPRYAPDVVVRWLLVLGLVVVGCLALLAARPTPRESSMMSLDVGQGDSTLLDGGLGVLIDTGVPGSHAVAKAYARNVPVHALILTHLELDHAGDAPSVMQAAHVTALFWNGRTDVALYVKIAAAAHAHGVPMVPLQPGDVLHAGALSLRVVWPNQAYRTSANQNDGSLVLRADLPGFSALVTGDLPVEAEQWLPKALVDVDVLKVGHHGSKGSSSDVFLRAVTPQVALISVGAKNHYGHPTPEALARLSAVHAAVYRTDQQGSLSVYHRGGKLVVVPERARQLPQ